MVFAIRGSAARRVQAQPGVVRSAGPGKVYDLGKIRERLEKEEARNEDVMIPANELTYEEDGTLAVNGTKFGMTEWSTGQLAKTIGIPVDYLRRTQQEQTGLAKANVDHWLADYGSKNVLLRLAYHDETDEKTGSVGRVRAILSDKATPFSHLDIVNTIQPFAEKNRLKVVQANLAPDDKSFHLRLVYPETVDLGTTARSDPHQIGVHIANSEIGFRFLTSDLMAFRQVCTNGLIAMVDQEHILSIKHVKTDSNVVRTRLLGSFDVVNDRQEEMFGSLRSARAMRLPEPEAFLRSVLRDAGVTKSFLEEANRAFEREPINTRFGVVQAITRAAQTVTPDKRLELEELAGRVLMAS